jgi:carbamoyltransferase
MGFNANRDEGKLMGLAAYGEARKESNPWIDYLNNIVSVTNNKLLINPYFFKVGSHKNSPYYTDFLVDYITSHDPKSQPIKQFKDGNKYLESNYIDLAYATQYKLEEALVYIVKELICKTNLRKLCIAGGLGLNCKANRTIFSECDLEDIFIHPASSDDGSSIGAAFYLSSHFDGVVKSPINNAYFGVSFSNDEIEKVLKNCGVKYYKPNEICKETAKLLNNNQIIGWFQGASEMGARALGARSIIANPFDAIIKDKINSEVKYREEWRPYCPSLLSEFADKYLKNSMNSKYMILACEATTELKEKAPAVVHVDNTVRPQCVKKEDTPIWHNLLSEFNAISDIPVLLNTSFNVRGEPIVNSPLDAIRTFYSTGLNSLVIGNFILTK